ncbi:hypothetical protein B0H21DRAFT_663668, partial [Amylocystis lapponica]
PTAFTRVGILNAVAEHIVYGDQAVHTLTLPSRALLHADEKTFNNCLYTMHPKTSRSELPSRSTVRTKIENSFIDFLADTKADI